MYVHKQILKDTYYLLALKQCTQLWYAAFPSRN